MLDNIGVPYSGMNLSYSSSGVIGTSDAEILISLNPEHHHPTAQYVRRLRRELPARFPGVEFFFQPADIVSQILNFGLPAPVDIQVVGADMRTELRHRATIANQMRQIPGTADVHVQQMMSLPTLHLDMDRTRINQVGLNARDVAQSVLISLSGSFQTAPNFWLNPKNGVTYPIAIQIAAISHDVVAGPDEHAGEQRERAGPAGARQPGSTYAGGAASRRQPLQRAAGH